MLVEHARNLFGISDASHAEYGNPGTHIVTLLSCSLRDNVIDLDLTPGSMLRTLHGNAATVQERTTCNYGLEPAFAHIASEQGMIVAGIDNTGEVRAIERTDHPFFVGTLYQPQLTTSADQPHPIWLGFVRAVAAR